MTIKRFCAALLFLQAINVGVAQVRFAQFSTEVGLSQNTVLSIIQDRTGFIWIGTEDGLNRYDGFGFQKFHAVSGDSTSLPADDVWSLMEDKQGRIWIGHGKGISYYDIRTHRFHNILVDENITVVSAFQDSNQALWFGTAGSGLIRLESHDLSVKWLTNNYLPNDPLQAMDIKNWNLTANYILSIKEVGNDLLLGTRGAGIFRLVNNQYQRIHIDGLTDFLNQNDVWDIQKSNNQEYCLATVKGLGILNESLTKGKVFSTSNKPNSLSFNRIARLQVDGNRGIWVATYGGGLNYFDFSTEKFNVYTKENSALSSDLTFTLLLDNSKNLWIGTWAGGLNKLNRNALRFHAIKTFSGKFVTSVATSGDSVFVSTYRDGLFVSRDGTNFLRVSTDQQTPLLNINSVWPGSKFWVGIDGGGVVFTSRDLKRTWRQLLRIEGNSNSIDNHLVDVVMEDVHGKLWVGTRGSGLKRIDPTLPYGSFGSVIHYNANPKAEDKLPNGMVSCIGRDVENYLWVGTLGGLSRSLEPLSANPIPDKFITYKNAGVRCMAFSEKSIWVGTETGLFEFKNKQWKAVEGLKDDFINTVILSEDSTVWVSTNLGIVRISENGGTERFTTADGLQSKEFNVRSGCITRSGNIYLGGVNGLNFFDPGEFKNSVKPPTVVISSVTINNQNKIFGPETVDLSYQDKLIEFEFAALDFTNPELNHYQYRLVGFNDQWLQILSGKNTVTFTNLDPGTYYFEVRAANSQGTWSTDNARIPVLIAPPLWRTYWAYAAYAIFLVALIFLARRNIINRERLKARIKIEQVEIDKLKEQDEFKSKLFDNITHEFRTPLTLILGQAKELLGTNAFSRETLQSILQNGNSLLTLVNQMLDLSRIDAGKMDLHITPVPLNQFFQMHGAAFHSIAVSKGVVFEQRLLDSEQEVYLDISILEKAVNNLLSNAIKYTPAGGHVLLQLKLDHDHVVILVKDTGVGIEKQKIHQLFQRFQRLDNYSNGTGIGLALTQELVKLHGGSIEVESEIGIGTQFTIEIPIIRAYHQHVQDRKELVDDNPLFIIDTVADRQLPILLLVEDNIEMQKFIKRNLDQYKVLSALNGEAGLQLACQYIPDIVISDWIMPEMDGLEFCRRLREKDVTSHIPIVMLTAKGTSDDRLKGFRIGIDDFLTKPFEMEELKVRIHNLLEMRRKLQERFVSSGFSMHSNEMILSIDEKFLARIQTAIEKYISDTTLTVETLSKEVGVSRVQLHRKLTALLGMSASEVIREFRLRKAADLLRQKVGNVSEIAFRVGFDNLSYFSKVFKERYHVNPSDFPK